MKTVSRGAFVGRIIGFVVAALVVIAAIVAFAVTRAHQNSGSTASSSQTQASATPSKSSEGSTATPAKGGRTLVVIFSSKTAIYGLSHPAKIGNTMRIANMIVADTGADKYEIVPTKPYGNYNQTVSLAQKEQNENARPAIKNPLPDVSKYSTVFVGAPVWWGEYPMVVRTFLDHENLNGKTMIPFATSEGSGLGNFKEQLEKQYPKATIRDGFYAEGQQAAQAKPDVDKWLDRLSLRK